MMTLTAHGQALLFIAATSVLIGGAVCTAVLALLWVLGTPASRIPHRGGRAMTSYTWRKEAKSRGAWHRLIPSDAPHWHVLGAIGTVCPILVRDMGRGNKRAYRASYRFTCSTGNAQESWANLGSVQSAKAWIESQLAKFWEPPTVTP